MNRSWRPLLLSLIGLLIAGASLYGCVSSKVGGERREMIEGDSVQSIEFNTFCSGECMAYADSGTCVTFTSGISDVCADYFMRVAVINGDCNVVIGNNSGRVDVNYDICLR